MLRGLDERTQALRDAMSELLRMDEQRRRFAAMMSGLDIHYDLGEGHPQHGRRMPDLDLGTADGRLRVFTLLHEARPALLNIGEPGGFDIAPCGRDSSLQCFRTAQRGGERPAVNAGYRRPGHAW